MPLRIGDMMAGASTILAGGPGSGRHPGYGSFKKVSSEGNNHYWVGKNDAVVRVQTPQHQAGATSVFEENDNEEEKQMFRTHTAGNASQHNDLINFMNDRYGIQL